MVADEVGVSEICQKFDNKGNNKQYTQYSFYRRIEGSTIYIIIICPVNGCRVSSLLLLSNSDYTFRLSLKSRDYRYIPTSNKD